MATMIYIDQENGSLNTPAIKPRQKLLSVSDKCLKTPLSEKSSLSAPLKSNRKALGTVNKIVANSSVSQKGGQKSKPIEAQKCKVPPQQTKEEYPEIEKCFPYSPDEFETDDVPEEVRLSHLSLAGLARLPRPSALPEEDFDMIEPCLPPSPVKSPTEDYSAELKAFLQTISELTVDLPPECEY
ncbi:securin [Chanos chanos]|uniref:Securin n=1 Tax=Chanos chanos TaxID=29144 RepID=A0A6J2UQM8_CHACN|nr:securin-like [Chanos chanos]